MLKKYPDLKVIIIDADSQVGMGTMLYDIAMKSRMFVSVPLIALRKGVSAKDAEQMLMDSETKYNIDIFDLVQEAQLIPLDMLSRFAMKGNDGKFVGRRLVGEIPLGSQDFPTELCDIDIAMVLDRNQWRTLMLTHTGVDIGEMIDTDAVRCDVIDLHPTKPKNRMERRPDYPYPIKPKDK